MCKTSKQDMTSRTLEDSSKVLHPKQAEKVQQRWRNPRVVGRAQTSWTYFPIEIFWNIPHVKRPSIVCVYIQASRPHTVQR